MKYPFYKKGNLWIVNERYQPPGTLRMNFHDDEPEKITFWGVNNYFNEIPARTLITDIVDENGNSYADKAALIAAIGEFFAPLESVQIKKINGHLPGTLFGDDFRSTSKKPISASMWSHGLPLIGTNISITGSGKWYIPDDVNDINFPDGVSIFETGIDSNGKIFITSVNNRYEPGSLSYFCFTKATFGLLTANGDFILLFGAIGRGVASEGNYDQIKEGHVVGYKGVNGVLYHIFRVYKNFQYQEMILNYDIETLEQLKIHRLEIGYLGSYPTLYYKVDYDTLSDELHHVYRFKQSTTSVQNPNLALGVYIENLGNTTNIAIRNGSFQFGNLSEREGTDPSARNIIDTFESISIASGTDTVLAVYSLPEILTMYDSIDSTGIAGATTRGFYNKISTKLNNAKATGIANKTIYVRMYIVPKSDVVATYTPLRQYVNAIERAVGLDITSVDLSNANLVGELVIDTTTRRDSINVKDEDILMNTEQVGIMTISCSQSITDFSYIISLSDLF